MKFIALMLAFILGYLAQHGRKSIVNDISSGFQVYLSWFTQKVTSVELSQGWGGVLMFSLAPALLLGLMVHFISGDFLLLALVLHIAVLFFCLIPVDPQILSKEDTEDSEDDPKPLYSDFSIIQITSVVFWYFVIGPVGALMMRLLFEGLKSEKLLDKLATVIYIAKWLPVRFLILSYALVGNFHGVLVATGADCLRMDKDSLELEKKAAESALWPHFDELDETQGEIQMVALYRRALLCWLTVIALISVTI